MSSDFSDPELREQIREIGLHSEEAEDIMRQAMSDTSRQAKLIAPKRTGRMASRITWSIQDSVGGISGTVSAPAPANLLSTRTGKRLQSRAWGHRVRLWHVADDAFLKRAFMEVQGLFETDEVDV